MSEMPSIHTLHDFDHELSAAYSHIQEGQKPPRISDEKVAYDLGHELMQNLADVDAQYDANFEHSTAEDDPIAAKQQDLIHREEGIQKAITRLEMKHKKQLPIDFINGESHYKSLQIDPDMDKRLQANRDQVAERQLGKEIDAMGLDGIDPNYGNNLMRKLPEDPESK